MLLVGLVLGLVIVIGAELVSGVARAACLFAACVAVALIVGLIPTRLRARVTPFIAAFVAAAGVLSAFLSDGDDGAGDSRGSNGGDETAGTGSAINQVLTHVPSSFRESCTETPNPPDEAPGTVNCSPTRGAGFVQYREYVDNAGMKLAFDTDIEAYFGTDPPLRNECGDDGNGLDTWEYGRRLCNVSPDRRASIVWTDNRLNIYSWARRGDDDFRALLDEFDDGTFGPTP